MRLARALLLGVSLGGSAGAHAADPSALWKIVNGKCVPDEKAEGNPAPCAEVDLANGVGKGFAVLKDIVGVAQFLLIPTARIDGIEDPAILAPGEANYWNAAWHSRHFVEDRLHRSLPRDAVALAINSSVGRTQNQLHIHIDCIRPDVRAAIAANLDKVAATWTPFPVSLVGHSYRSILINRATLDGVDPFRILADSSPDVRGDLGMNTLVLVGAHLPDGTDGFVLLDDHVDLAAGDLAAGEQLQDHTCTLAKN